MNSTELQLECGACDFCAVNNLRNLIVLFNIQSLIQFSLEILRSFTAAILFCAKHVPSHPICILFFCCV